MADPVIVDWYRAQAVMFGRSGLPKDQFVTDWAFRNDGGPGRSKQAIADACRDAIQDFLTNDGGAGGINGFLTQDMGLGEVHVYDLGQAPPRTRWTSALGWFPNGANPGLPEEVAVRVSVYCDVNQPRSRGGMYLGPFGSNAVQLIDGHPRPSLPLRNACVLAAENLIDRGGSLGQYQLTWGLISQVDGDAKVITNGWVDDAFDTVKKRGLAPTGRLLFPAA